MSLFRASGKPPSPDRHQTGVALVTTLAMVVIVSLLLVAFITMVRLDHSATQGYGQAVKAEQLALGSLKLITNELQKEMAKDAAPNLTYADYPVYTNVTSANILPQRVGVSAVAPDPMPNLVKTSTHQDPFFTGTLATSKLKASTVSSTTPSFNGRQVSASRWQQVYLGNFPDEASTPHWVILTRNGPTDAESATFGATGDTLNNSAPTNSNYAIGRFAYAIYDVGGLLNVNVAGYPNNCSALAKEKKGMVPWADLAQIPGIIDPNALVKWRNAATGIDSSTYLNYVGNFGLANGFAKVSPGDTTFLGRGDLIHYARENPTVLNVSALPYLTTFSRDLIGPKWGPKLNGTGPSYQYLTDANSDSSINRFLPNVRVTTAFTRADGTAANVGEPLLAKRFPLNRLGLVTYTATADDTSDIFKYFGLKRSAASNPWVYCNSDGSPATVIKTLKQVADEGREPNFFELLYACILNGSLGQYNLSPAYSFGGSNALDSNPYIQAIRIGANIIDQYDSDNYPTVITYGPTPTDTYKFYGIEDIPYPNKILLKWVTAKPVTATNPTVNWCTKFNAEFFFEMWNPHQQLSATGLPGPTEFRVVLNPLGASAPAMYSIKTRQISSGGAAVIHGGIATNPVTGPIPSGGSVRFNATAGSYREPLVLREDSAVTPPGDPTILSFPTSPTGSARSLGFKMQGPALPGPNPPVTTGNSIVNLANGFWVYELTLTNVLFSFQQKDSFGNWQTYATSSGLEELPSTGINKGAAEFVAVRLAPSWTKATNMAAFSSFIKSDPRTSRFGLTQGESDGTSNFQADHPLISSTGAVLMGLWGAPFYCKRLDLMAYNQTATITGYAAYGDADGVKRPGDSYLEDPTSWESSSARPPMKQGVTETRPIILNRPFRSVGELGYVFRDMPWKTLDLFSPSSADSGLLDVFSVDDSAPLVTGQVSLNTRNPEVLTTLLTGMVTREATSSTSAVTLDAAAADKISRAIVAASTDAALGGVMDLGDLASRVASVSTAQPSKNKMEREAVMRALAGATSTRTWNLLIDVVAQVGKYPAGVSALDKFVVEGERRYWMHVAIDRYTGKVLDQNLEIADE